MTGITISDVLTIIYVLVDDWCQVEGVKLLKGKAGKKPEFNDSELMTLISGSKPVQSSSAGITSAGGTIETLLDCSKALPFA